MCFETLNDVLLDQLGELRDAEEQLVRALPMVAGAASGDEVRRAVQMHLEQARSHLTRLDRIGQLLAAPIPRQHCDAMEGLLREAEKVAATEGYAAPKDTALVATAQRVWQYEIAAYDTARSIADQLDLDELRDLLDLTIDENMEADARLNEVAACCLLDGDDTAAEMIATR